MSIQGGGKLPPSSTGRSEGSERPRRAAEKRQARETGGEQAVQAPVRKDVFETGSVRAPIHTPPNGTLGGALPTGQKLEEALSNPSQIKQMSEAIAAHAKRLAGESDELRGEAQSVVGKLASQGFSPEAITETRTEIGGLRKQMAQLRGKIASDGRRLKILKSAASKLGDTKLSDKVGGQLKSIADMEKGWGRTFLALGIAGTIAPSKDGEAQATRVGMGAATAGVDRHALGGYLAQVAPGTASSQLLVALLEEGPQAPSGRLVAEAYAELHADVMTGRLGKALQGLGLWRQAMG